MTYLVVFNMIIWTFAGTARRFSRAPREPSSRSGTVRDHALAVVRWPWRPLAGALAVLVAIDCACFVVERWNPRPQEPGATLANWNSPKLTPAEVFSTELLLFAVINLAFLATVAGGYAVMGRFKSGRAGPGTAFGVLALLPIAVDGVGGTLLLLHSLFR
jgi:hypothetical protein